MYKHGTVYSLVVIAVFIIVLLSVSYHGYNNRLFAPGKSVSTVNTPEEAYTLWNEKKVRGRILLTFDRYPHSRGLRGYNGIPRLTASNLIEYAIFHDVIRKIYFIVPDNDWEEFRLQKLMHPIREVPGIERGLFLYTPSGIPLIATTPSSLPQISEKALVYINNAVYDQEEAMSVLSAKRIDGDIIAAYSGREK